MIERRFKREIIVEETYLNYTTYTKYFRKRFKREQDLQDYISYLQDKAYENSTHSWKVNYYIKVDSINKYIRL